MTKWITSFVKPENKFKIDKHRTFWRVNRQDKQLVEKFSNSNNPIQFFRNFVNCDYLSYTCITSNQYFQLYLSSDRQSFCCNSNVCSFVRMSWMRARLARFEPCRTIRGIVLLVALLVVVAAAMFVFDGDDVEESNEPFDDTRFMIDERTTKLTKQSIFTLSLPLFQFLIEFLITQRTFEALLSRRLHYRKLLLSKLAFCLINDP